MNQYSRRWRFNLCRRVLKIGGDGAELFEEPGAALAAKTGEPAVNLGPHEFDEALEQISLEGSRACPLCGAIVVSHRSVLRETPAGLSAPWFLRPGFFLSGVI